jgi:hypothetical protein
MEDQTIAPYNKEGLGTYIKPVVASYNEQVRIIISAD